MNFDTILIESSIAEGFSEMPNGSLISIKFLNENFGKYETVDKMIGATNSEGLKNFFQHLKDDGKLS